MFLEFFPQGCGLPGWRRRSVVWRDGIKNLIAVSSGMRKQKHLVRTALQFGCERPVGRDRMAARQEIVIKG